MDDFNLEGYKPSSNEEFMNQKQQNYFRAKLQAWKYEIMNEAETTRNDLRSETGQHADFVDRASVESSQAMALRARDRERKLIAKIDAALRRIDEGAYGYCVDTGEPIGINRLEARPTATLSLEAQERHERNERTVHNN